MITVLEAALEEIVRRTLERMETASELKAPGDIEVLTSRVCRYLPTDKESREEWRVWLAFWGRAIADERLRDVHRRYYQKIVDRLIEPLRSLRTVAPVPSRKKVRRCADALIAAIDGIGTRATLEPTLWPPKRQHETLGALLLPMLAAFASGTDDAGVDWQQEKKEN